MSPMPPIGPVHANVSWSVVSFNRHAHSGQRYKRPINRQKRKRYINTLPVQLGGLIVPVVVYVSLSFLTVFNSGVHTVSQLLPQPTYLVFTRKRRTGLRVAEDSYVFGPCTESRSPEKNARWPVLSFDSV